MAAASVTMFWPLGDMTGFSSSVSARHGLSFKVAVQKKYKLSSNAGVNSVMLRPGATWIIESDGCTNVTKAMKKVGGHNAFTWAICATSPGSRGNEPLEEETCNHHEDIVDNAPDEINEKLGLDQIKKLKLRIYIEYLQDHLSDEGAVADARDQAEYVKEIKEMKIILQLEELQRQAANAEDMRSDNMELFFAGFLMLMIGVQVLSSLTGDLGSFGNLLKFLTPAIKKAFLHTFIEEYRKLYYGA